MTGATVCRVGRRIASTGWARMTWWTGVGALALATKVCCIQHQPSALGVRSSGARGVGYQGVESQQLRQRQIGRTACIGAGFLQEVGGARRIASRTLLPATPLTAPLLATNEHTPTFRVGGAR